ncbi:hypothetical protein EJ07DRAFT_157625 [Lizonia empirigonia]|nr:hypothetical protein EJ07DRAFT_157625 [Lizonia empirigonia]
MTSPYSDSDVALPRAGFLSYFWQPHAIDSCDKVAPKTLFGSPYLSDMKHSIFDEEAQSDFGSFESTTVDDCEDLLHPARHRFQRFFDILYDLWSFICIVTLVSCTVLVVLNLAFGQYGSIMGQNLPPTSLAHELRFCLASPNREAPGPQIWRLMSSGPHNDCTTEIVTLLVSPSEGWKFHSDDEIVFGDDQRPQSADTRISKFLEDDDLLGQSDLGDNVAEEGVLSQSGETTLQGGAEVV